MRGADAESRGAALDRTSLGEVLRTKAPKFSIAEQVRRGIYIPPDETFFLSKSEKDARIMRGEALVRAGAYRDGRSRGAEGFKMLAAYLTQPFTAEWREGWRAGRAEFVADCARKRPSA